MSKRKVSVERNTAAKDATRRPSIPSIQTRVIAISQRRRSRSGKSPLPEANLNQGTMTKLSKTVLATGDNVTVPPKTAFNSQDKSKELRSSSSPRLKSFPAERIRKFDNTTLFDNKPIRVMANQNSEHSDALFVPTSSIPNHEHGDHVHGMHNGHQPQSQTAENTCQQQICTMHQSIPQSDGAVTYRVHGPDRHRPNVPHGHQSYVNPMTASTTLAYVHNGQTPVAQSSTPITLINPQQSLRNSNEMTNVQKENNWVKDELPRVVDLEKQPVGGRNLMLHRQAVMQERQQQQQQQQQQQHLQTRSHPAMYSNDHSVSVPPSHNFNSSQTNSNPIVTRENPQQIYQQFQNNLTNQQQMQQRAMNQQFQMMSGQQQRQYQPNVNQGAYYNYFTQPIPEKMTSSYGMTSPQDANINQTRNTQNAIVSMQQKQQLINQQNKITPNSQISIDNPNISSQIRPYTINLVDNNKSQNVTYNHHHGQVSQLYRPPIPGQQLVNYYQQNMIPQNDVPQQIITTEVPTNLEKRNLKFTPKMIRDQELLVATMKQQGISDELMRRQFDHLLKEQRRQLEYLEQFHQEGESPDTRKQETRKKIQMDEKPEWMAHITPPHIPYSDLEKLNTKIQEENVISPQHQVKENYPDDYNKIQQNGNNQKMIQSIHDQSQQKVHQLWQQQNVNWQQRMGFPTTGTGIPPQYAYGSSQTHPLKSMSVPPQQYQQHFVNNPMHQSQYSYWQYPQQMQQPYQQQYYQTPQQVAWQHDQSQNEKNSRLSKKAISLNDLNIRNVEPSSLLKLRLYKEVIRPQKRNNGLQDPETIQKALEILNNPESHAGLEYLANLNRKKPKIKLNGIQDPNDITPDLITKPTGFDNSNSILRKGVSANGLENSRNPNNPLPQPLTHLKRSEIRTIGNEYPKQKQNNPRNRYSLMAEREDGTVAPTQQYQMFNPDQQFNNNHQQQQQSYQKLIPYNDKNALSVLNKPMSSHQFDGSLHPDYYQQMQQFNQNKQNLIRNNGQGDVPSLHKSNTTNIAYLDSPGGDTADLSYSKENRQIQNKMAPPYTPFGLTQRLNGSYNSMDIREAKTIGGVTYLARKSEYIPNQPMIPGNLSTTNKYIQPNMIYH